jgi:hypothetical protein
MGLQMKTFFTGFMPPKKVLTERYPGSRCHFLRGVIVPKGSCLLVGGRTFIVFAKHRCHASQLVQAQPHCSTFSTYGNRSGVRSQRHWSGSGRLVNLSVCSRTCHTTASPQAFDLFFDRICDANLSYVRCPHCRS